MAQRADIQNDLLRPNHLPAVAVPDLQIRGWGSGGGGGFGPSDPEIRGAPVSKRFFFASGGRGEGASPGEADKLYATVTSFLESCI